MLDRMGRGFLIKDPERRFGRVWMNGEVEVSVGTLCSRETTGYSTRLSSPPPLSCFLFFTLLRTLPSCLICFSSSSILTTLYFSAGHSGNAMGFSGTGFLNCVFWFSSFSRRPFLTYRLFDYTSASGGCLVGGDDAHVIEACSIFSFSVCRLFTTTQPSRTCRIDNNTHTHTAHTWSLCISPLHEQHQTVLFRSCRSTSHLTPNNTFDDNNNSSPSVAPKSTTPFYFLCQTIRAKEEEAVSEKMEEQVTTL